MNLIELNINIIESISVKLIGKIGTGVEYYRRPTSGDVTVSFIRSKIIKKLSGITGVVIYDGAGNEANGNWKLKNLRVSYNMGYVLSYREAFIDYINIATAENKSLKEQNKKLRKESKKHSIKINNNQAHMDPYEVLHVSKDATEEDITKAYREKSSKLHPDKIQTMDQSIIDFATEKMKELNMARDLAIINSRQK